MSFIDISWPLSPAMTQYKTKKEVQITATKTMQENAARETLITLGSHTGTHIDAPAHFIADGCSIDQLPLELFIGPCVVVDCTHVREKITLQDCMDLVPSTAERVLFKTQNSFRAADDPFNPEFIYLDGDAARFLAKKSCKLVGIDYLGIERNQPDRATHIALLQARIAVLEGLRLAHVEPGTYTLWALPLLIPGLDAAPARAILGPAPL